jgi:hypothetical protein
MFWEEEPGKDAKINLCLYGINDYRWEENSFWISFNKGSSIKCDEVSIDIPLDVMTDEQINDIFKIDNY